MLPRYGPYPQQAPLSFGDVRAIAQGAPSAQAWDALVEALDHWPDVHERDQLLIPYLRPHLMSWPDELRVASWPWLARVIERERSPCFELARAVDADHRVYRYTIKRLAKRPALSRITHLTLRSNALDASLLRHVVNSAYMLQMRSLTISHNALGPRGIAGLRDANRWARLTQLALNHVDLDRRGAYALATSELLPQLSSLSCAINPLGAEGLRALLSAGTLPALHKLALSHCHLHDEGARTLFAWRATPNLQALDLSCNGMSEPRTLEALVQAEFFMQLERLALGANFWRGEALALILREADARALKHLGLSSVGLGAQSLALLLDCEWMTRLESLNIERNGLGPEGLKVLALASLPMLETLNLTSVGLSDEALARFAKEAKLPALKELIVEKNRLKGPGLYALAQAPGLPKLKVVRCRDNPLDAAFTSEAQAWSRPRFV